MDAQTRAWLKRQIDQRRRQLIGIPGTRACAGCGVPLDGATASCAHCSDRRRREQRVQRKCRGCGCVVDEFTAGCVTCRERLKKRRRFGRSVAVPLSTESEAA